MEKIYFSAQLYDINSWIILRFPKIESEKLSSRGAVMVEGTLNGAPFKTVLEPDGMGSHWFKVDDSLSKAAKATSGDEVEVVVEQASEWVEPELPEDIGEALEASGNIGKWESITTRARWEWIRWIRFTKNPNTRQKRIDTACSMLSDGKRRPCCFDQSRCTETFVSKSGVLLD